MRRLGRLPLVLTALALLWAGFAVTSVRPPRYDGYLRSAVQVAEAAHNATRTGWLTGRQVLAGQVFPPFAETAFDDATRALGGAQKQFAEAAPPDERSKRLRDELASLLQRAGQLLSDAAQAPGDAALRAAVDALGPLADQLDAFVEAHQ